MLRLILVSLLFASNAWAITAKDAKDNADKVLVQQRKQFIVSIEKDIQIGSKNGECRVEYYKTSDYMETFEILAKTLSEKGFTVKIDIHKGYNQIAIKVQWCDTK